MQTPLLYLGLIGFDSHSEQLARRWIESYNRDEPQKSSATSPRVRAVWQIADHSEADAIWVHGAGVLQGDDHHLRFHPKVHANDPSAPIALELRHTKKPLAFCDAEHLQSLGVTLQKLVIFDLRKADSLKHSLALFEARLQPLCALFALAAQLVERRNTPEISRTYHLEHQGRLTAIVDTLKRRVYLRLGVLPASIYQSAWLPRPNAANSAPSSQFSECTMDEAAWVFAMHCSSPQLPKRYLNKLIHIKRNPPVRDSWLYPRHAALIDYLWQKAGTLAHLNASRSLSPRFLERDLYALYLTRTVSTIAPGEDVHGASSLQESTYCDKNAAPKRMNTIAAELATLD